MPSEIIMSIEALNAQGDVLATMAAGGYLNIYGGKKAKRPKEAPTGTLLVKAPFTAFEPTEDGVLRAALRSVVALADGDATWFRVATSNGTTGVWDGTVGEEDSDADMIMRTTKISAGVLVGPISFEHDLRGAAR